MNSELQQLISDTLIFLKDEGLISRKLEPAPQQIIPPKPKPIVEEKSLPSPEPVQQKKESRLLFEKIQKHLPHIRLVEKIPAMQQVAIVLPEEDEPAFFHNLKKAINERLCPAQLIDEEQLSGNFALVLSQTPLPSVPKEKQILLEKVSVYQNNTEKKKQLWINICQSLKSS